MSVLPEAFSIPPTYKILKTYPWDHHHPHSCHPARLSYNICEQYQATLACFSVEVMNLYSWTSSYCYFVSSAVAFVWFDCFSLRKWQISNGVSCEYHAFTLFFHIFTSLFFKNMFNAYAFPCYWNVEIYVKAEVGPRSNIWHNFDWLLSLIKQVSCMVPPRIIRRFVYILFGLLAVSVLPSKLWSYYSDHFLNVWNILQHLWLGLITIRESVESEGKIAIYSITERCRVRVKWHVL